MQDFTGHWSSVTLNPSETSIIGYSETNADCLCFVTGTIKDSGQEARDAPKTSSVGDKTLEAWKTFENNIIVEDSYTTVFYEDSFETGSIYAMTQCLWNSRQTLRSYDTIYLQVSQNGGGKELCRVEGLPNVQDILQWAGYPVLMEGLENGKLSKNVLVCQGRDSNGRYRKVYWNWSHGEDFAYLMDAEVPRVEHELLDTCFSNLVNHHNVIIDWECARQGAVFPLRGLNVVTELSAGQLSWPNTKKTVTSCYTVSQTELRAIPWLSNINSTGVVCNKLKKLDNIQTQPRYFVLHDSNFKEMGSKREVSERQCRLFGIVPQRAVQNEKEFYSTKRENQITTTVPVFNNFSVPPVQVVLDILIVQPLQALFNSYSKKDFTNFVNQVSTKFVGSRFAIATVAAPRACVLAGTGQESFSVIQPFSEDSKMVAEAYNNLEFDTKPELLKGDRSLDALTYLGSNKSRIGWRNPGYNVETQQFVVPVALLITEWTAASGICQLSGNNTTVASITDRCYNSKTNGVTIEDFASIMKTSDILPVIGTGCVAESYWSTVKKAAEQKGVLIHQFSSPCNTPISVSSNMNRILDQMMRNASKVAAEKNFYQDVMEKSSLQNASLRNRGIRMKEATEVHQCSVYGAYGTEKESVDGVPVMFLPKMASLAEDTQALLKDIIKDEEPITSNYLYLSSYNTTASEYYVVGMNRLATKQLKPIADEINFDNDALAVIVVSPTTVEVLSSPFTPRKKWNGETALEAWKTFQKSVTVERSSHTTFYADDVNTGFSYGMIHCLETLQASKERSPVYLRLINNGREETCRFENSDTLESMLRSSSVHERGPSRLALICSGQNEDGQYKRVYWNWSTRGDSAAISEFIAMLKSEATDVQPDDKTRCFNSVYYNYVTTVDWKCASSRSAIPVDKVREFASQGFNPDILNKLEKAKTCYPLDTSEVWNMPYQEAVYGVICNYADAFSGKNVTRYFAVYGRAVLKTGIEDAFKFETKCSAIGSAPRTACSTLNRTDKNFINNTASNEKTTPHSAAPKKTGMEKIRQLMAEGSRKK